MATPRVFRMSVPIFGRGPSDNVGTELKALGARKVLIVTNEII